MRFVIPMFNASGELFKIQKIDKVFRSPNSVTTGYSFAHYDGKIYLVYNDRKTGSERKDLKKGGTRGGRNARFTDLTVIGQDGEIVHQETLFSNKEIDLEFVPSFSEFLQGQNAPGQPGRCQKNTSLV